jgi:hypothetical protein
MQFGDENIEPIGPAHGGQPLTSLSWGRGFRVRASLITHCIIPVWSLFENHQRNYW